MEIKKIEEIIKSLTQVFIEAGNLSIELRKISSFNKNLS